MSEPVLVLDNPHLSEGDEQDADGWYVARCACGWAFGPLPDSETRTDVLMEHSYQAGLQAGMAACVRSHDDAGT